MKIILLGPPGAGKGTQAKLLCEKLSLGLIAVGEILRDSVANGHALGLQAKSYMDSGKLVPDTIIIDLVKEVMQTEPCTHGFLLDGFPRTKSQALALQQSGVDIDFVIHLQVSEQEIIKRLSGRRVHLQSGRVYHIEYNPPKTSGKDDVTGEELIIRDDDQKHIIKHRLAEYNMHTEPLIEWYNGDAYTGKAKFITIQGVRTVEDIFQQVIHFIKSA